MLLILLYYVTCRVPSVTRFAFFDGIHISIYLHECKFIFCICQLFYVRWKQNENKKYTWTWVSFGK